MKRLIRNLVLNTLGWICVLLGAIGAFLPLLPTTPFLILALFIFSKSSERFHTLLLNNRWFGEALRRWERDKTISRRSKRSATWAILATFSLSIAWVYPRLELQLMLATLACVLLFYIWRLKESAA